MYLIHEIWVDGASRLMWNLAGYDFLFPFCLSCMSIVTLFVGMFREGIKDGIDDLLTIIRWTDRIVWKHSMEA